MNLTQFTEMKERSRTVSPLPEWSANNPRIDDQQAKKNIIRRKEYRKPTQTIIPESPFSPRTHQRQDIAHQHFYTYEYRPGTSSQPGGEHSSRFPQQLQTLHPQQEQSQGQEYQIEEYVMDERNMQPYPNGAISENQPGQSLHQGIYQPSNINQYMAQSDPNKPIDQLRNPNLQTHSNMQQGQQIQPMGSIAQDHMSHQQPPQQQQQHIENVPAMMQNTNQQHNMLHNNHPPQHMLHHNNSNHTSDSMMAHQYYKPHEETSYQQGQTQNHTNLPTLPSLGVTFNQSNHSSLHQMNTFSQLQPQMLKNTIHNDDARYNLTPSMMRPNSSMGTHQAPVQNSLSAAPQSHIDSSNSTYTPPVSYEEISQQLLDMRRTQAFHFELISKLQGALHTIMTESQYRRGN